MSNRSKFPNFLIFTIAMLFWCAPAEAQEPPQIDLMVSDLDAPWGMALLPDGAVLVTQKGGELIHAGPNSRHRVSGVPKVRDRGQGGLLDITLARDFARSRTLYLTYAKRQRGGGSGTAVGKARLSADGKRLEGFTEIFEMRPGSSGGRHFGSRLVEARDGTLFVTIGERGDRPAAQDLARHEGSVIRINADGSIPADNPFVNVAGARPEIWSYGHRNPQGAALDLSGNLWLSEHGAKGGDEVNRITKGANYGWPVISYGRHYSGGKIGVGTAKDGMEQPEFYWDPSIAPSGLLVHSGKMFPEWKGHLFVGSLKFDYIARLSGASLTETGQIKSAATERVRDIIEGPDGAIWFISVGNGAIYRISRTP